jgi:hypothetical protein
VPVVIPLEITELRLQISGGPEQRAVQTFASDGPNQPFDERMRERDVRHGDPRQDSSELILAPAPARIETCSNC